MLFEDWVDLQEAAVNGLSRVVEDHLEDAEALIDGLEQSPIALLALLEGLLGAFSLEDVVNGDDQTSALGGIVRAQDDARMGSNNPAVFADDPLVQRILGFQAREQFVDERLFRVAVYGMSEVGHAQGAQLRKLVAEDFQGSRVGLGPAAFKGDLGEAG